MIKFTIELGDFTPSQGGKVMFKPLFCFPEKESCPPVGEQWQPQLVVGASQSYVWLEGFEQPFPIDWVMPFMSVSELPDNLQAFCLSTAESLFMPIKEVANELNMTHEAVRKQIDRNNIDANPTKLGLQCIHIKDVAEMKHRQKAKQGKSEHSLYEKRRKEITRYIKENCPSKGDVIALCRMMHAVKVSDVTKIDLLRWIVDTDITRLDDLGYPFLLPVHEAKRHWNYYSRKENHDLSLLRVLAYTLDIPDNYNKNYLINQITIAIKTYGE